MINHRSSNTRRSALAPSTLNRRGVTLTEVLMSLMIMSIGISSVAVLFPISALRSMQASQLTNAAVLVYNARNRIAADQRLIFDPDGDYRTFQSVDPGQDRLRIHYQAGSGHYLVDPLGFYSLYGADNNGDAVVTAADDDFAFWFGNNGTAAFPLVRRFDGGVMSRLGYDPLLQPSRNIPLSTILSPAQLNGLNLTASRLSRLGSGWEDQLDTFPANGSFVLTTTDGSGQTIAIGAQLDSTEDLAAIPSSSQVSATSASGASIADPEIYQIVIYSLDGRFSQAMPLTRIDAAARKVFWSEYDESGAYVDYNQNGSADSRSLAREFFDPATNTPLIGRLVLQSQRTNDYNWLLSVRRSSDGRAVVDVLIRHGNAITVKDESIYPVQIVDNLFLAGLRKTAAGQEPPLKRGGYFYEVANGRWYRIATYEEKPLSWIAGENSFWAAYDYRLTLQGEGNDTVGPDAVLNGQVDAKGNPIPGIDGLHDTNNSIPTTAELGGAIFMPGIVDVYPMGTQALPMLSELQ